ncbi:hypothetical protein Elgi_60750 [Paenibacillus elgii]|nr:hypothetical protein Elgi_60750 [Paenibacillus elgii]
MELNLLNEAEMLATPTLAEPEVETVTYSRKKAASSREDMLDHFPMETITYELSEAERICSCCGGALHAMSTETRNELSVILAEAKVVRHVHQVYACRRCELWNCSLILWSW